MATATALVVLQVKALVRTLVRAIKAELDPSATATAAIRTTATTITTRFFIE